MLIKSITNKSINKKNFTRYKRIQVETITTNKT